MKTILQLKIYCFVIFAIFYSGCSTANTTSLDNEAEINFSSTPKTKSSIQDSESIIVKEKGWQVPQPKKSERIKTEKFTMKSEDGKDIKVNATHYAPIGKFIYRENPLDTNQEVALVRGELELLKFIENKVEENIFLYTVFARKASEQPNEGVPHNHMFVYQIMDRDGDGKFEALLIGTSNFIVPTWALQKLK